MAGRPVDEKKREERKREVDTAISAIQRRKQPVTKKTIAEEMGITVQSLYGPGFLSRYVKALEDSGVVAKERGNIAILTAAEEKALRKENAGLRKDVNRLKEKVAALELTLTEKDKTIAELNEQLEIERGNTFLKQKRDFAQRRI